MFTAENVLTAEFTSKNIIKVTHKSNDDVLVTVIQKNPRKESYKSLIESGWTLKRIAERTKELQPIDTSIRLVESIANGYSWANDQLKTKLTEIENCRKDLDTLYTEMKEARENLADLYLESNLAVENNKEIYSAGLEASKTLTELYNEQQTAT